jgi:hypothetical protein
MFKINNDYQFCNLIITQPFSFVNTFLKKIEKNQKIFSAGEGRIKNRPKMRLFACAKGENG